MRKGLELNEKGAVKLNRDCAKLPSDRYPDKGKAI